MSDEQSEASPADVDVEKLADKVYRLLLADVRLGQARGEPGPRRPDRQRQSL
jgi:hypothetical protein